MIVPDTSRLSRRDLLRVGGLGLRSRRVRAALSALGISIGIAAIVGVLGISQSSKTGLLNELGQLGNLLTVQPQDTGLSQAAELPATAEGMISRIGPVTSVTQIGAIADVDVYRTPLVPATDTSGISLTAADPALPATLGASLAHGVFLNGATTHFPAVVLGAETASLLAIGNLASPTQVFVGGHWFTVVGIMNPVELLPQLDSMAFIGFPIAEQYFGFDGHPTGLYLRSVPSQVTAVAAVLPATADPADPSLVAVSYPAGILEAALVTKGAYNGLFLALGAVALLVGGVGIANVMVISVLERRSEIGLRRALGATRRHVAEQFLTEALLLSALGGLAGTITGAVATVIYAVSQHWSVQIPAVASYGGLGAALVIGAIAGLYPATRAARLSPTQALRAVLWSFHSVTMGSRHQSNSSNHIGGSGHMSNLIAIAYDDVATASAVRDKLIQLQSQHLITLEDAVVVERKQDGKIKLLQAGGSTAGRGAIGGALWGGLIGMIFFMPFLGAAIGAGTGALAGSAVDSGVDDNFMRQVGEQLTPGKAALFVLVVNSTPEKVLPEIVPFGGTIINTSLSPEAEEQLREAVKAAQPA